jgi:hypothetical protein
MGIEDKIKDLPENHHLPLVEMTRAQFKFNSFLLNEAEYCVNCYAARLGPESYLIIPYETLLPKNGVIVPN